MTFFWRVILLAAVLALAAPFITAADAAEDRQIICQAISEAALANGLPVGFLARLLWTESGFRSTVISRAGAEGVAQFMPETAALRGLANPLDPLPSIQQAARLLVELSRRFGNLGLAAAAYNAGAPRIAKWLHGGSVLPIETRLYVLTVTGRSPEDWAAIPGSLYAQANYPLPGLDCLNVTAGVARHEVMARWPERGWQARLDNHPAAAIALFDAAARGTAAPLPPPPQPIPRARRHALDALCGMIRARGATCQVVGQ